MPHPSSTQHSLAVFASFVAILSLGVVTVMARHASLTAQVSKQPYGVLDLVTTAPTAYGWTCDPQHRMLVVHIYADGPVGQGKLVAAGSANQSMSPNETGLVQACGSTYHRFILPLPRTLCDSRTHTVYAYGINADNPIQGPNSLLSGSPKPIVCQPKSVSSISSSSSTAPSQASSASSTTSDRCAQQTCAAEGSVVCSGVGLTCVNTPQSQSCYTCVQQRTTLQPTADTWDDVPGTDGMVRYMFSVKNTGAVAARVVKMDVKTPNTWLFVPRGSSFECDYAPFSGPGAMRCSASADVKPGKTAWFPIMFNVKACTHGDQPLVTVSAKANNTDPVNVNVLAVTCQ